MFWFPVASRSYHVTFKPLMEELVRRGHRVTLISSIEDEELCSGPLMDCSVVRADIRGTASLSRQIFEGYEWAFWGE